jgi:hypothetical protein
LHREGRLTLIERVEDVENKIALKPRPKQWQPDSKPRKALHDIVGAVEEIVRAETVF